MWLPLKSLCCGFPAVSFSGCHRWEQTPSASSSSHSPNDRRDTCLGPGTRDQWPESSRAPELMSSSLSTHLVSETRSLLRGPTSWPVVQWSTRSGQFRVGSQSREALKFVFLFLFFWPLENGAGKFVKWLRVGTGHGTWILGQSVNRRAKCSGKCSQTWKVFRCGCGFLFAD